MSRGVLILGAGFGGLELSTFLSEALGADANVTVIDKGDAFVFGFSKLDVLFGRRQPDAVRLPYREFAKPGVRFRQEMITSIDPSARRVTTNGGTYDADVLVVSLGSDNDLDGTPGLADSTEFYSVAGAARMAALLPEFKKGRALIGICGAPYKCTPAPSEAALLLHEYLSARGLRNACEITIVSPLASPVPPAPDASRALLAAFAERNITFIGDRKISSLDTRRRVAQLDDGRELSYDLFFGVPKQRAPKAVELAGMTVDGYVPVNVKTLETKFPGVYALGDCATQGTPKAGVFAEGAARVVASELIADLRGGQPIAHAGTGFCYVEFGEGQIGRVDIDSLSQPKPTGAFQAPSTALRVEKDQFSSSRRARWFARHS